MDKSPKTSPRILVAVDFSAQQDAVVARALDLAARLEAELFLLHCASPLELSVVAIEPVYLPAIVMERFASDHLLAASTRIEELAQSLSAPGPVHSLVRATTPVEGILELTKELDCDYIVMGSHGAGMDRFLLGSVAESVVRYAPCPVIVQRESEQVAPIESVLVGIDFSSYSRPLVELARSLASTSGEIHLLHCWQPPHLDTAHVFGAPGHESLIAALNDGMKAHCEELDRFVAELPADNRYCLHVEAGRPAKTMLESFDEYGVQAAIVGAHDAKSVGEHLLGSVADRILRHAKTTVLLTEAARARWAS
jgi:nucleotide-binding universal stress UspA family protein